MTQLALLKALAEEIYDAIDRYGEAIPLASAVGVLEVVKFELIKRHINEDNFEEGEEEDE